MDNNTTTEKILDDVEILTNKDNVITECEESDENFREVPEEEVDEEALAELKKFEASVNKSFKNVIMLSAIILGAAVLLGVVLAIVL